MSKKKVVQTGKFSKKETDKIFNNLGGYGGKKKK